MTKVEDNKAAVRACFHNASQGNYDALHEVLSTAYVKHPEGIRGVDGLAEMVQAYRDALADLTVTVEHQFTDGDYVATRSTISGRHEGDLMGASPTGLEVSFSCLTISRCKDGKIEEEWEIADAIGLMQQVGAIGAPA